MYFGNFCQTATVPLLARGPSVGGAQSSMELKPLLPFSMFPGFRETAQVDRSQKAMIGPGFGLATSSLTKRSSSCGLCQSRFISENQGSIHHGTKQPKRLKVPDPPDCWNTLRDTDTKGALTKSVSPCVAQPCSRNSSAEATAGSVYSPSSPSGVMPPYCSTAGSLEKPSDCSKSACPRVEKPSDCSPSPCPGEENRKEGEEETGESEAEKAKRLLYCSLCKVAVNSTSQLQAHNTGTKHKTMMEARSGNGAIKSFPRSGVKAKLAPSTDDVSTGLQNKTFHCEICNVHVNSETQLKQHICSRRHKDRAAGKPVKPKFSPYVLSPQCHHEPKPVELPLRTAPDAGKPLPSCLLQHHLSFAAAMATMSPFHMRPTPTPGPALFQTPPIPQVLLHSAPGPHRSAHTSVLFSPY
ncbi:hypothetical protein UPYG_G00332450 [Umbra pygmaea]|uniref:C2H2-type domain-containing protein n=1 Tax=Umbra pygmaea TaxID=75934 RepID=A0ABD0VWB5_UMBPY